MPALAQITLPKGQVFTVEWSASLKSIVYSYQDGMLTRSDEPIGTTLARHLQCPASELVVEDLRYYEQVGVAVSAPEEMRKGLLACHWSDYANDHMSFQCSIHIREW